MDSHQQRRLPSPFVRQVWRDMDAVFREICGEGLPSYEALFSDEPAGASQGDAERGTIHEPPVLTLSSRASSPVTVDLSLRASSPIQSMTVDPSSRASSPSSIPSMTVDPSSPSATPPPSPEAPPADERPVTTHLTLDVPIPPEDIHEVRVRVIPRERQAAPSVPSRDHSQPSTSSASARRDRYQRELRMTLREIARRNRRDGREREEGEEE